MGIFSKIVDGFGGSIVDTLIGTAKEYFPPDMPPEAIAKMELAMTKEANKQTKIVNANLADAEKTLNDRIAQQEGTASDLRSIWGLGHIVLFLRGLQRPVWGFSTLYIDFLWFTTPKSSVNFIVYTEQQQTALIVINILVLGFLFGERTIKNLEPLIIKVFGKS
jgi:hypothetical protein